MSVAHRCLVIENDPTADARRLGDWLADAGLDLEVVRPHATQPLPGGLDGYAALVVLGGRQHAYPTPDGRPGATWFPELEGLLRAAVRHRIPTLAVGLGAQLLAVAHGGNVAPAAAGPEIGARLVAKRDAAESDPLFGPVPMLPDVVQWRRDEVSELPAGAVLLAAATSHPHQAFRMGRCAWAMQFHIECDTEQVAQWAEGAGDLLAERGLSADEVVAAVDAIMDDLFEAWQPLAQRFAMIATGELALARPTAGGRDLPLVGH